MSQDVPKKGLRLYAVAFAFGLAAAGTLLVSGLTRSLSSSLSRASIALSITAMVLGVLAIRR